VSTALVVLALLAGAGERDLAALVVLGPKDQPVPRGPILEATSAVFESKTSLDLRSSEQLGLDESLLGDCPRASRLSCIVEHVARRSSATVVVVASMVPIADRRHRLQVTLIDIPRARAELTRSTGEAEATEDAIYAGAITGEPEVLDATDRAPLAQHMRALLENQKLAEVPHWLAPLAVLSLSGLTGPTELRIDGAPPIVVDPSAAAIHDLRPGKRQLTLSSAAGTQSSAVDLVAGQTTTVPVVLVLVRPDDATRELLMYGGFGLAAVGVTAAIISAVSAASVTRRCIARPADLDTASCSGLGWPGFGVDGDALPALSSDRITSGPPLFVLGAGLAGLGLTLGLLEGPLYDAERPLWVDLAAAAGVAILGVVLSAVAAP